MSCYSKTLLVLCAAVCLAAGVPSSAQAGVAAPRGTYLQTCNKIQFNGKTLSAMCKSIPDYRASTLDVSLCGGDIWNQGGYLYCRTRPGVWGQGHAIPSGSYFDSCGLPFVQGTVLHGECRNRGGHYNEGATLELRSCRMGSEIANNDGQLICLN